MIALIGYLSRQLEHTTRSTRWLRWLMALLISIAFVGAGLMTQRYSQAIEYPQRYLIPTPMAVCPGETLTYPVVIKGDKGDAVSRITEGWCRADTGICPRAWQAEPYYVNFVDPYSVSTSATRTVPVDLPSGEWQFRHCNETHSRQLIDVVCYQVAIEVKDCEAKP